LKAIQVLSESTYDYQSGYNFNLNVFNGSEPKIHTIRSNYELWANRISEIQEGKAILSIRYWSGKPCNSKQVEICRLGKDSGIGVQKLEFVQHLIYPIIDGIERGYSLDMASNDGLSVEDFAEWFKNYDLTKPMAIIHFTQYRY
jgi:hypothetical protein